MTNQETKVDVAKSVIVMKSGLSFWVKRETADRASAHIVGQQSHSFLRIAELGETINTAEIEGIYTPERYTEIQRVEAGEWKCQFEKWHTKKGRCECEKEAKEKEENQRKLEEYKEPTEEERQRGIEKLMHGSEYAALDGSELFRRTFLQGNKGGKSIRRVTLEEWEKERGRKANITGLAIN